MNPSLGISRRLAIVGGLVAFAGQTAGAVVPGDAELLALCDAFRSCGQRLSSLNSIPEPPFGTEALQDLEARRDQILDERCTLLGEIAETPARTRRGIAAKAVLVQELLPSALEDFGLDVSSEEIRLVLSLARDVAEAN
ncbi:hypothetical protein [Gluconobacter japonicus]|uniref:hypothetical protein n=1 Tax=Gluconobacter japonicus TaxID=376620 RepID=UPI000783EA21|nr:hypothetical protein [Gluconobacter japonicus]